MFLLFPLDKGQVPKNCCNLVSFVILWYRRPYWRIWNLVFIIAYVNNLIAAEVQKLESTLQNAQGTISKMKLELQKAHGDIDKMRQELARHQQNITGIMREEGSVLTQSYDKSPYTHRKIQKAKWQHKKRHQFCSILVKFKKETRHLTKFDYFFLFWGEIAGLNIILNGKWKSF